MDKFKELSIEDMQEVQGGNFISWSPLNYTTKFAAESVYPALCEAADFVSGLGEGFLDGFSQASKSWH